MHSDLPALGARKGPEANGSRLRATSPVRNCDLALFQQRRSPDREDISYILHILRLSERRQQKLQEKLERVPQPVVFLNLRDGQCSECRAEIAQGSMLLMEANQALCLDCARLDDLELLPAGDR